MLTVFAILPTLLMLLYPTRTFQKCLNCCGLRCLPLHIFMDAFQGCYKNGTDGTRDYRYFAGLYLLFRFLTFGDILSYFIVQNRNPDCFLLYSLSPLLSVARTRTTVSMLLTVCFMPSWLFLYFCFCLLIQQ